MKGIKKIGLDIIFWLFFAGLVVTFLSKAADTTVGQLLSAPYLWIFLAFYMLLFYGNTVYLISRFF